MAQLTFVTGGSRSGKSQFAQKLAESLPGPRVFVATCPIIDEEMRERVLKHQKARRAEKWRTVEETHNLYSVIVRERRAKVLLIDCLTLWVNNLLYDAEQGRTPISERKMKERCRELIAACAEHPGHIIFVSSEVGMGIVPESAMCRQYRDLVGRCNQVISQACDRVIFMVSGHPMELKKEFAL